MFNNLQTTLLLLLLTIFSFSTITLKAQQGTMNEVTYTSSYGNGQKFGYLEYLPPSYSSSSKNFAVLISLHGKGWMADGQTIQFSNLRKGNHVAKLYYYNKTDFPFIVISPQQPKSVKGRYSSTSSWDVNIIDEVLERVKGLRRVDTNRIYITGTSMGGGGVWKYLKAHGDKIAAAAPMAGAGNEAGSACSDKIKKVAVWGFHNSGDNMVSVSNTIQMVDAINACSPPTKARKTIFKNGTHNTWDRVYRYSSDATKYQLSSNYSGSTPYGPNSGKPHIFDWFLTHSRDGSAPPPPSNLAPVAKAGSDKTITLPTNQVTLNGGSSSDSDGSITSYKWTKVSGPSTFSFSSASSKSTYAKNLVEGTYVFRLTVNDDNGASDTDDVKVTVEPEPISDAPTSGENGIKYAYYEGNWDVLPNFGSLTPKKTGTTDNFSLSPKQNDGYYAFKFSGFIDIKSSGTYTFYTASDDGSKLYINGKEIVNNDGRHGEIEKSGQVSLSTGKHAIQVTYFDKWGNNDVLKVKYKGPNISKKAIPNSVLYTSNSSSGSGSSSSLAYSYYEGSWNKLPNFGSLTPKKTGKLANFSLSPRLKDGYFAFKYDGYINVATGGIYTFYTSSDDGSKLYINDELIVNNDGLHGKAEKSGQVYLSSGNHKIKVTFFEKTGSQILEVSYKGPNFSKKRIPDSALGGSNARTEVASKSTQESETAFGRKLELESPDIFVYPNPASQYLKIGNAKNAEYTLFDNSGRSVLTGEISDKEDINISALKNGLYLLRVNKEDTELSKKILIQH
jgi:poly(3-hydroxybutyrate) depolymerase